jgi:hypothetical protein
MRISSAMALGLFGGLLACPARGADFDMSITLDNIKIASSIAGPKVTDADLKGKVVLMEFWGIK